jgi:tripartite-type tricarboxylate transporter receptor subunit TctC
MKADKTNVLNLIGGFLILVPIILFGVCNPQANAASAADFYKGKKVIFIVTAKAGGGTDIIARIVAPYLKKLTGAYSVEIDNVEEAGGMVAANRLWNSKPDGLTLYTEVPLTPVMMELAKQPGMQFKCDKFNVIFALTSELGNALMVNAKGPFQSLDDLKKAKRVKSATVPGRAITAAYFADVLGLDARVTVGMSTGDSRMALLRGEIEYLPETPGGALEHMKTAGMRPLVVDRATGIPVLPGVPSATQLVSLTPQQKEWTNIFDLTDSGKYVFTGPNVPKERIEYLRNVFETIHKDPEFLNDRKKYQRWPGAGEPWLNGGAADKLYRSYLESANKGYTDMVSYLGKKYYTTK